jgi:FixJ family two-component response regulator
LSEAGTILIAVEDAVLADSLRFSLELEGYAARLCDEHCLLPAMMAGQAAGCLVLDQDVFTRMAITDGRYTLAHIGIPVVLMVGNKTQRLLDRAKAAGVTRVVEKPLLGGVLLDEIRKALHRPNSSNSDLGST